MSTAKPLRHGNATKGTEVVSLRIDGALLDCVRDRARDEGRSLSGTIVSLLREQLAEDATSSGVVQPITGWLAPRPVPSTLRAAHAGRRAASRQLLDAVKRKARRT